MRKTLMTAVALTAAILTGGFTAPQTAAAATKVVFAQPTETLIFMPVYIARGMNYFADEGLDAEVIIAGGGSKAAAALIGGSADFVPGAFAHVVKATDKGQQLVAVAGLMNQIPSNMFLSNEVMEKNGLTVDSPLEKKIAALKGLKIGITSSGSMTDLLARRLLELGGMNPDVDATIIPLGGAQAAVGAVDHKAVDATVMTSPILEIMEDRGLGKTMISLTNGDVEELRGFLFSTINARRAWVEENPDITLKVVKAIVRAEKYIKENPDGSLAVLRKFFPKTDPKVLEAAFKNMSQGMMADPTIVKSEAEKNIEFINLENKINGLEPVKVKYEDVVTNEFVAQAKEELGQN